MTYEQFVEWLDKERQRIRIDELPVDWSDYHDLASALKHKTEAVAGWEKTQEKYFGKIRDLKSQISKLEQSLKETQTQAENARQELEKTPKLRFLKRKELEEQVERHEQSCQRFQRDLVERRESIQRVESVLYNLADGGLIRIEEELEELKVMVPLKKRQLEEREERAVELHTLAVERYGHERREFLKWWEEHSHELSDIPDQLFKDLETVRTVLRPQIMEGLKTGNREAIDEALKTARSLAEEAQKATTLAHDYKDRIWSSTLNHQRNLSGKELHISNADIREHDALTKKMYEETRNVSVWPIMASRHLRDIKDELRQLEVLGTAEEWNVETVRRLVTLSRERLEGIVKEIDSSLGQGWTHIVADGVQGVRTMLVNLQKDRDLFLGAAAKMYEQATSLIPPTLVSIEGKCTDLRLATELEMMRVPRDMANALAGEVWALNEFRAKAKTILEEYREKYDEAMKVVEELGKQLA